MTDVVGGVCVWVGVGERSAFSVLSGGIGEAELLCCAEGLLRLAVGDVDFCIAGLCMRDFSLVLAPEVAQLVEDQKV